MEQQVLIRNWCDQRQLKKKKKEELVKLLRLLPVFIIHKQMSIYSSDVSMRGVGGVGSGVVVEGAPFGKDLN